MSELLWCIIHEVNVVLKVLFTFQNVKEKANLRAEWSELGWGGGARRGQWSVHRTDAKCWSDLPLFSYWSYMVPSALHEISQMLHPQYHQHFMKSVWCCIHSTNLPSALHEISLMCSWYNLHFVKLVWYYKSLQFTSMMQLALGKISLIQWFHSTSSMMLYLIHGTSSSWWKSYDTNCYAYIHGTISTFWNLSDVTLTSSTSINQSINLHGINSIWTNRSDSTTSTCWN